MIKYRKAREIIDQVSDDLSTYYDSGLIDYGRLYKVIRKCNAFLGERINPEKQAIVNVKNFRGVLPSDFSSLNYALFCRTKTTNNVQPPQGFKIEYKTLCEGQKKCGPYIRECDTNYIIYQLLDDNWTQYTNLETLKASTGSFNYCSNTCPNIFVKADRSFHVNPDMTITTDFCDGDIFIDYSGAMEDSDEDLMVIDHPLVEPYYENELTKSILKYALYNKESDVAQIYGDAKIESSRAKIDAMKFVAMPGYDEIRDTYQANRVQVYKKYFTPFIGWS